jgi:hypothetical protein
MKLLKELKIFVSIIELLAAVSLAVLVFPLGILHNIIKPFVDAFKFKRLRPLQALLYIVIYYLRIVWHILIVIMRQIHELAKGLDILGNVVGGEAIEDLITPKESTYYGDGRYTISAATGYLVYLYKVKGDKKALNKLGLWFDKALNKAFNEDEHALWSYEREMLQKYTKENKGIK